MKNWKQAVKRSDVVQVDALLKANQIKHVKRLNLEGKKDMLLETFEKKHIKGEKIIIPDEILKFLDEIKESSYDSNASKSDVFMGGSDTEQEKTFVSDNTAQTSTYTSMSGLAKFQTFFNTAAVSLQDKKRITNNKYFFVILILNLYQLWTTMFLPTLGEGFRFGYYGDWVFRAANYPITLSLDLIPYDAMVAIAFIGLAFSLVHVVTVIATYQSVANSNKSSKIIKKVGLLMNFVIMFSNLIVMYIYTSFFDCNPQTSLKVDEINATFLLNRYPNMSCYDSPNVIFLVVFIIATVLLLVNVFVASTVSCNVHPMNKSWFILENSSTQVLLNVFNTIEIFLTFIIPSSVAFGRSIVHLVLGVVWVYLFFINLPFFRSIENSIYFGMGLGKMGAAIGTLISFFVNVGNDDDLGLGMMGLTLGLIVLGFLIGFIFLEVYTRALIRIITKKIENDPDVNGLYAKMESDNYLKYLHLFLRFSIGGHYKEENIGMSFAKAAASNKNFNNSELLLTCSLLVAYKWDENGYMYALFLLRKADKTSNNFLLRLNITERMREVEVDQTRNSKSGQNFIEIKHIIDKLEKGKDELKSLHRHFWKELVNEFPNMEKLDQINRRSTYLCTSIDETYDNLMSNYSKEIVVVRNYANFLELFKFDMEQSQALYQEALKMDEDNYKQTTNNSSKITLKNKKVSIRQTSGSDIMSGSNREEQELLGDETFSGVESRDISKKEVIIKSAIKTQEQRKGQYVSFVIFTLCSYAVVSVCLALSISTSIQSGTTVPFVFALCKPSTSSIGMMREVRMRQNMDTYLALGNIFTKSLKDYSNMAIAEHKDKIYSYKQFLQDIMTEAQQQRFSAQMYKDFTVADVDIVLPAVPNNFSELNFISTLPKKASILEMTNLLSGIGKNFYTWDNYNTTVDSFDFMYMWQNMITARDTYVQFCQTTITNSSDTMITLFNIFLIVFGSFCGGYCLSFVIYLTVMRIDMSKIPNLLKIFTKSLSKNALGRIYHELGSKNDEDATIHLPKSNLTQARNLYVFYGVLILLIIIGSTGLMVINTKMNVDNAFVTTKGIQYGTSVLRVVHGITLIIGEYFSYLGLPKSNINDEYMTSEEQIQMYHSEVKNLMDKLFADWGYLIYGGGETSPSVGKYATVDIVIQGISNCSSFFNANTSDILTQWKHCEGLENMISFLTTQTAKFNEQVFNPLFQQDIVTMFDMYLALFVNTNILSDRVLKFLSLFVEYTANPPLTLCIISAVVAYISLSILLFLMFEALESNRNQLINLRNMFHYVPVELIDSVEVIRNFILYNHIPGILDGKLLKRRRKNQVGVHDEDSKVKSILNASVEGSVMADAAGFIELINPAAQRMFGSKQSEVVGTPLISLFDMDAHDLIKKTIAGLKESSKKVVDAANKGGEYLEIECVRKNLSKFPVKLNIFIVNFDNIEIVICFIKDITSEKKHNTLLAEEKAKSEGLLRNILPEAVATRLKQGETFIAEKFADISVFFSDMVGFTRISSDMNPNELVGMLNFIVNGFDQLTDRFMLEKIKTIGDAYFCVGGLHDQATSDHPERVLNFAMSVFHVLKNYNTDHVDKQVNIRVGINTGPAIAGVIGVKKFAYDLWGDTINFASRMESNSIPGRIQISRSCYERVHDLNYEWEERRIDVKGKGVQTCYLLSDKHHINAMIDVAEMLHDDHLEVYRPSENPNKQIITEAEISLGEEA